MARTPLDVQRQVMTAALELVPKLTRHAQRMGVTYWEQGTRGRDCFFRALALAQTGKNFGLNIDVQVGTAFWVCRDAATDDGVRNNRFGYQFGERDGEFHCWNALCHPDGDHELLDLWVQDLPYACRQSGHVWDAPEPPAYYWCNLRDLPPGTLYNPCPEGIFWFMLKTKELLDTARQMRRAREIVGGSYAH